MTHRSRHQSEHRSWDLLLVGLVGQARLETIDDAIPKASFVTEERIAQDLSEDRYAIGLRAVNSLLLANDTISPGHEWSSS